MKQSERSSIMRILSDLIRADEIIDTREIQFLNSMKDKYDIKKEDELLSDSITLSQAIKALKDSPSSLIQDLLCDFTNVAMSDDYCTRFEALLIATLVISLTDCLSVDSEVVSVKPLGTNLGEAQILYVENCYDKSTNEIITEHYRELYSETQLMGFDFVYIPKITDHYNSLEEELLLQIISFLYPHASQERLKLVIRKIKTLSTSEFCKDQLYAKLKINELFDVQPSLLIKLGDSYVNNEQYMNLLILGLSKEVIPTFHQFVDIFSTLYKNRTLNYLREEKGRFVYTGFYKQVLDS